MSSFSNVSYITFSIPLRFDMELFFLQTLLSKHLWRFPETETVIKGYTNIDLTWCVGHDSAGTYEYLSKDSNPTTCFILHKCCWFRFADVMVGPQLADLMCSVTNMFIFKAAVFTGQVKGTRGKIVLSHYFWLECPPCLYHSLSTVCYDLHCAVSQIKRGHRIYTSQIPSRPERGTLS